MFEIGLKFKINGREVQCDPFIDALKLQLVEAVKVAIPQQPAAPCHRELPQQNLPSSPRAFSVGEAAKLLSVSKATISRRIREGKLHSIRVRSRVLVPWESIQKLLRDGL